MSKTLSEQHETTTNVLDSTTHHRVVALQDYDEGLLYKIYDILKVEVVGEKNNPVQGRIATNIIQETNKGKLLIRIYPKVMPEKLETGSPIFELTALDHFASCGVRVPIPVKFGDNLFLETNDQIIFGYFLLLGEPIERSALSIDLASKVGSFLNTVLDASARYVPKSEELPVNTFTYILDKAQKIEQRYPELQKMSIWDMMKKESEDNVKILEGTPTGIVHADYFFENILINKENSVVGLIDFGDAYYGYLLHDVVIGAMEASVTENEIWVLDIFGAFLQNVMPFLKTNKISFEQFLETLKLDCLRFAVYTVPFTSEENKSLENNPYINRYQKLLLDDFIGELHDLYTERYDQFGYSTSGLELSGTSLPVDMI